VQVSLNSSKITGTLHEYLKPYMLISRRLRGKYKKYGTAREAEEIIRCKHNMAPVKCDFYDGKSGTITKASQPDLHILPVFVVFTCVVAAKQVVLNVNVSTRHNIAWLWPLCLFPVSA
jgi:hypothetical protein